jgi:Ala-tRNA(Pro) deacylase
MQDIYKVLKDLNIDYIKHEHPPVYTCEEADKYYKDIKGGKSKNLFIRNKKGDKHYLVIVESSKMIDLKGLANQLGENKLSFASERRLMEYLGIKSGAVSPFGLINDKQKVVEVIIDNNLMKCDRLHYHPNINTATLEISTEDFKKFLVWTGNSVSFFEI